jgi:hypothetical protein
MMPLRLKFPGGLKMRGKLLLAFLGLSLLIAVCGACGLLFIERIGANVTVFADVTSPMLGRTLRLVENAQQMRAVLVQAGKDADGGKVAERLTPLEAVARKDIEDLRRLSDRAGLSTKSAEVERRLQDFANNLRARIAAQSREHITAARTQGLVEQFVAERRSFESSLTTVAGEAETKMVEAEDRAKIEVQTGAATVEPDRGGPDRNLSAAAGYQQVDARPRQARGGGHLLCRHHTAGRPGFDRQACAEDLQDLNRRDQAYRWALAIGGG